MNKAGNQVGITPLPSAVEGKNLEGVPSLNGYLFHWTSTTRQKTSFFALNGLLFHRTSTNYQKSSSVEFKFESGGNNA